MSLRKQITLVFFILVTGVILTTISIIRYYSERLFTEEFRKEAMVMARTLSIQSRRALLTNHFSDLMFQIQALAQQDNILYVMVCSRDGTIRAHNDLDQLGRKMDDQGFSQAISGKAFVAKKRKGEVAFYQIAVPVKIGNRIYGVAEIGYDLSRILHTFRLYDYLILLISSSGIIIGPLICMRLAGRITAPIMRLQAATYDFTRGKFDVQVPVESSGDEVGQLSETFNKMTFVLKRTILKLKHSYLFLNKIVTNISDILLVVDEYGNIVKANPATARAIGTKSTVEVRKNWKLQDLFILKDFLNIPIPRKMEFSSKECYMMAAEGPVPVLVSMSYLSNNNGKNVFVVTGRIIKEIKMKEEQLWREHHRLATILQSLGEGVIVVDGSGTISLVNDEMDRITGLERKEVLGKKIEEILHFVDEESSRPVEVNVERLSEIKQRSLVLKNERGEDRMVVLNAAHINFEDNVTGFVIVVHDISEKVMLEREIIKAQKIEALGLLAGGIAHDFNNMLMGIQGYINLTQLSCSRGDKKNVESFLARAERAVDQARDLAQQLLTFSKGGAPVKTPLLLQDTIKEIASFVVRGSAIKSVCEVDDKLWPVEADPSQISQVLNNLLINAVQAMPEGGTIILRARNVVLDTPYESLEPGRYVQIQVEDQGYGIPKKLLRSIFDLYFTTKEEGNGLGLAVVHSIIQKHGGHISVKSKPRQGTTFTIYLPATHKMPKEMDQDGVDRVLASGGRIIILDDDDMVREVLGAMLQNLGFDVVAVADGRAMLRHYKKAISDGDPFIMLITDITLPGQKNGLEYAKEVRKMDPDAIIIAVSGYANDPVMAEPAKFGFQGAISKPFKISRLQEILAEVLSKNEGCRNKADEENAEAGVKPNG